MTVHEASIHIKRTKPRRRIACSGVHLCAETAENPDSKRFSGIEKAHRNSIKITVDLWRRARDSNPRNAFYVYTISSRAPSTNSDNSPFKTCLGHRHLHIISNCPAKIKSFFKKYVLKPCIYSAKIALLMYNNQAASVSTDAA